MSSLDITCKLCNAITDYWQWEIPGSKQGNAALSFPAGEWKVWLMTSNQGVKEMVLEPGKEKRGAP